MSQLSVPEQVADLLYNQMTLQDVSDLSTDDLIFLHGILHHWAELTDKRIQERKVEK